nr:epiplakin [Cavia porcellus]
MNGQAPPHDVLVTSSTKQAMVTKNMKAGLETSTPRGQVETPLFTKAKSIAGVYVEASGQTQSIYAATKQGLLPAVFGLALLEAQAATGGLVDPAQGQLLPVSKALQQGLVGLELKEKLLAAERAVTGYPDPYGGEKLALFQAMGKKVVEWTLGCRWLEAQLATGGLVDPARGVRVAPELACQQGLLDQETWLSLSKLEPSTDASGFLDPNTKEQLLYSTLLARCVQAPGSGLALLSLKTTFHTLAGAANVAELLEVGVLDKEVVQGLQEGTLAISDVSMRPEVQRYLEGTSSVAGIVLLPEGHKKSFFQATTEHLLPMGTALPLLESQAATRTLVDPATGQRLWVDEAVRVGLVGPELHKQLLVAEQAVTGYYDPLSSSWIPLFQAMKKELVDQVLALRLLDAQLATGGLVCPARRFRLPLKAALHLGYLDEETQQHLSQAAGFSDPRTHGSVSYEQLLACCVTDPETGLAFIPLFREPHGEVLQGPMFIEQRTRQALSAATASISVRKFQGRPVSLWELLFSEAVPVERRALLTQQYQEGTLSIEELEAQLKATIEQAAATRVTFAGLRNTVTPGELLRAEIIDQELYEKLECGQASAKDVCSLDSVQRYLQGTGCIAGLLLPESQERLSIYEACSKRLLRPGTALILLEAQAATGFIIDPKGNKRYSVEEALRADVIGPDVYAKLLSAERAITGYTDPYSGEQISLFQAMQKDLIVHDHAIRLLEAQIATGGIIDPVHSHRVPVDVAYQRGYFDQMLNAVLSDPSDDTKGFFDPNTHENLTYLQLLERCMRDPETGLYLLPLSSTQPQLVDGATREAFQNLLLSVRYGRFRGQRISAWELINSEYFNEDWRRRLLKHYRQRKVTLKQVTQLLETEMKRWADITLPALRGRVTAYQLLEANIIDQELLDQVLEGVVSPDILLHRDRVHQCLQGSGAVGGVLLQPSNQRLSLYQAMKQKLLAPGVVLALLEAQAATGAIIDPCSLETLSVDEAVCRGVVGPEVYIRLKQAEDSVTGIRDPFSGKRLSLFQAMKKGLIPVEQATRLLEAQVSTGGVIDPMGHYHLPMSVAIQRGCIDQEMEAVLSNSPKTFPMPDGQGHTTYTQLLEQCTRDKASGFYLLPLEESTPAVPTDTQIQETLQATPGTKDGLSLWDLLNSCHFTEEQRRDLLEDVRVGRTSVPQLQATVCSQVQREELLAQTHVTVPGPRGEIPAVWLQDAGIITQETLVALAQGTQSPAEVAELPAVKACLWGTGSVAGVLLQPSGTKVSISQAMRDGLLPRGLGQRLLEAQIASGFLIDPLTNQRLSVEDAVKAGLVSKELSEQLRQAEKAVAGYADPYSGGSLSLWQAMEKGLVPQREGFPLLQVQLATGGAVEPVYGVHLPQAVANRLRVLDEQTSQTLTTIKEDNKFFFDPSAKEKVTYQQLKERCVLDSNTGLWLLPLPQDIVLEVDEHTAVALRAMKVPISMGRFQGCSVSLWDLLRSEYINADKRQELVALCQSGRAAALRQVVTAITALVEAAEKQTPKVTFRGLRKEVSANDLFRSQLINKQTLDELTQGKRTVEEVTKMDSVKQSLEGGNFIAGILIQDTNEKMSISEALRRNILRPGTALVLLEAQAATGFIIDPVENQKLTVEEAFTAGMFSKDTFVKLLSAERAVTGYTDPYSGEQISLFQAMQRDLIVRDHGIRLLEAQIATGGIIDPVHSHRVPVDVAYQRGYFDEEMNQILADSSDDTKGFFDPNTHENLTYLQLLERCIEDPETGLYMLQIVKKGETYKYIDEATRHMLKSRTVEMHLGRFKGQTVSVWDVLCSQYFTEKKKKELVWEYRTQNMDIDKLLAVITTTIEEIEKQSQVIKVPAIQGEVTAAELFNSGAINKKTLDAICSGKSGSQDLHQLDHVNAYLEGTGCIAGVTLPSTKEVLSFEEASKKKLIPAGFAAQMLEAQAATGFLLDPHTHQKLCVNEAVAAGLVSRELQERLLAAERAAMGYTDPDTGEIIPLFMAMKKKLIQRDEALRLLEVQVATGGIVDPLHHHRLPLETAYRRGCLHKDIYALIEDKKHVTKRFVDPNTHDKVTYQELQNRCQREESGWILFPLIREAKDATYVDEATKRVFEAHKVEIKVGKYRDQRPSVWELLNSEYVTEEKKLELVRVYKENTAQALDTVVKVILQIIAEKETKTKQLWFSGIRTKITALELYGSKIITKETLSDLEEGKSTIAQIEKKEEVKRYLEGTSCIAGVLVPGKGQAGRQEKMSIYQAMWKGLLRPGTALVLLEAQAATGFVIDPVSNRKLSVEEAVAEGVVGGEIREKLLSAERAVTGYTDPYSGEQISLFQAMQRDLIVRDHGIRLLEAQIATGGIIDPVHSHRVPVGVAYQRGYFDEEMNRVLADPGDDTKGFFDPNTHENLTYVQLLRRCVRDPDTGLYMLQLAAQGSAVHQLSEELRSALRDARVTPGSGDFQGQSVSVWELLFYREVPESLRQDLLGRYRAGTLTVRDVGATLASLLARANDGTPPGALRAATMEVRVGHLQGRTVPVWDVLASSYVSGTTREELLAQFGSGALSLPALTRRLTTIIEEAEGSHGARPASREPSPGKGEPSPRETEAEAARRRRQEQALRAATMEVRSGQFQGQPVPVWDVLFSSYLTEARRDELLAQHAAGTLALPDLVAILIRIIEETETRLSSVSFRGLRRRVSASELHKSGILGPDTLRDLAQGAKTLQEVTEMDSVKRYLEGTSCIAGVLVPGKGQAGRQEKMSIYQAMWKGLLRPGTALVLLEAQAATGFVIDPVSNRKLSVEEAVAEGVVGGEIREKLLSAERAVTGYTDPYSGEQISLFQAMQRDLIVRDHSIRLLEAQIATGGIIDPVHSHRVPVGVAYQRGYFDEEMNRVLADPGDDTKGFFDPNTHENLTYVQLLRRCVRDPDTGLYMLQLAAQGSAVHQLSEELRSALRDARVTPGSGDFQGQSVSVWELLFYREVPESLRQDLLGRYRAGTLTVRDVGATLASLLARANDGTPPGALRAATMEVRVGHLQGRTVPVWDVLASSYVSGTTREELLAQFGSGALSLPALTRRLTTIIEEAEGSHGARPASREPSPGKGEPSPRETEAEAARRRRQEQALRAATMEVRSGQFQGQPVPVWDVLFSSYLTEARRDELLAQHAAGTLALPDLVAILIRIIEETETRLSSVSFRGLRRRVSASELHKSGILGPDTLRDLAQGAKTLQEVTEMDSVKRYLEGTSCIAGVLVPGKGQAGRQEKMSIYQAMWKGLLRPGTALVLLEAQAATGFVIDPVSNRKLSVEEAVAEGVVGGEIREKLLSAERAVTGYTDPYSGEQISLFQAMQRDLIVRDHGIRLLEAQIATGGIIDPVHSHRVPVGVAYQRGYFDEEMNRVLADPGDDTKGFFDPNTHENLTYMQLLERTIVDPDTGLLFLPLV